MLAAFKTANSSMKNVAPPLLETAHSMMYGQHELHTQNPSWGGWLWYVLVDRIPLLFPLVLAVAHVIAYSGKYTLWMIAVYFLAAVFAQVGPSPLRLKARPAAFTHASTLHVLQIRASWGFTCSCTKRCNWCTSLRATPPPAAAYCLYLVPVNSSR